MKTRLTITLPTDLLRQIDTLIDKSTIRNRSHAIEHLIRQTLSPQLDTAFILAGGGKKITPQNLNQLTSLLHEYHFTNVHVLQEKKPLGTAGAIRNIKHRGQPFLVIHGNIDTDIDLDAFKKFHLAENTLATIAVKPRLAEKKYGKVLLQGNKITDFLTNDQSEGISIINTGVYMFKPEILKYIPRHLPSYFETDVFPQLARLGQLTAYLFQGKWSRI